MTAAIKPKIRARRAKNALFQWEEDNPPGNCCSSRKKPERELLATAGHEASGAKGSAMAGSASTQARMKIERRASLETGNVTAEPVRIRRRPPSVWEVSSKSTEQKHRGIGAGMWAKEGNVNTGSPRRRRARLQLEAREGQARSARVTERSVLAMKRVIIVERRDLSSRAMPQAARTGRLA